MQPSRLPSVFIGALSVLALSGCGSRYGKGSGFNAHVPPFAARNWAGFSREDVVAIALREWRAFGQPVSDRDPHDHAPDPPAWMKAERQPGLWQRIGEYWWLGQASKAPYAKWTGMSDEKGRIFDSSKDGSYAWSAAFVSYVMRMAGANARFPYAPTHATYINAARKTDNPWRLTGHAPASYAPQPGDLLCVGRGPAENISFEQLPTKQPFPAHCGIVVKTNEQGPPFGSQLSVVGGNMEDQVALTHVPADASGFVADKSGASYDQRYAWCIIISPDYMTENDEWRGR